MPSLLLICLAFAMPMLVALAGRHELRISPRPVLAARTFRVALSLTILVLVPIGVYFYVFHGDWFLFYTFDIHRIPSAFALLGFVSLGLVTTGGFFIGGTLVRRQHESVVGGLAVAVTLIGVGLVVFLRQRLLLVGTFAQFRGGSGLVPFTESPLLVSTGVMCALMLVGMVGTFVRINRRL